MRIDVQWDNADKTAVRYDFGDGWTWEDLQQVRKVLHTLAAEVDHPFDLIANFENERWPSPGAMDHFRAGWESVPSNLRHVIVSGGGTWVRALVKTFATLHPSHGRRLLVAASLDEARALLHDPGESSP